MEKKLSTAAAGQPRGLRARGCGPPVMLTFTAASDFFMPGNGPALDTYLVLTPTPRRHRLHFPEEAN